MYEVKTSLNTIDTSCYNMTTENIAEVLGLYVDCIKNCLQDKLSAVYLFGSVARGDYTSDSDIDILLVLNMDEEQMKATRSLLTDIGSELSLEYNVRINKFSVSRDDFEIMKNTRLLFNNIKKEGVLLYNET